jgi:eukaryotic-like serine/threonine-protein kinase
MPKGRCDLEPWHRHVLGQVARALDHAHGLGVVHRDVKPANFLLSGPVGPDERVLLADFGIARALSDAGSTQTGSGIVTLSYAAPEALAGGPVDARSDLYSLGCSLFRMLTGKAPFASADGVAALVAAHLQAPPPRVTDQVPGLSPRMDWVIATALAKDPGQRFSSARQFAAAAAEALNDATVWATPARPPGQTGMAMFPPPPGYPVGPPGPGPFPPPPATRRRRHTIAAVAAVALVVVATAVTAVTLTARAHSQHAAAPAASTTAAPGSPPSSVAATTAAGPPPLAAASALTRFLLPAQQIAAIFDVPSMVVSNSSSNGLTDDTPSISEKDCTGPYAPADMGALGHAGSIGSQIQILTNPAGPNGAAQAVLAFPSADAAQRVLADQRRQWSACSGRTFTLTIPNESPTRWTFGPLTTPDGSLVMTFTAEARSSAGCQRVLAARNNVIIDVAANGFNVGNHGVDIANAIAAKIPQ